MSLADLSQPRAGAERLPWSEAAGLGLAVLMSALACIAMSRMPGNVAMVWYPNAIASGWIVGAPRAAWPLLLAATGLAQFLANVLSGDTVLVGASFLPSNGVDVLLATALLVWRRLHQAPLTTARAVLQVTFWGAVLPHLAGATLGVVTVQLEGIGSASALWLGWYEGGCTGSVSTLLLVMHLRRSGLAGLRALLADPRLWLALSAGAGATMLVLAHLPYPFVFISTGLLLCTLGLPVVQVLATAAIVSLVMVVALATGIFLPPPVIADWQQVFVFLALAAALLPAQVLSAALADVRDANARLAAREAALRRAHERLEEFVRIASHDLREPLNTVVQFSELLQADHAAQLAPDGQHWLRLVHRAGTRMRTMLDDVLQYVRVEQGQTEPHETVDLDRVLAEVQDLLAARVLERDAVLQVAPLGCVHGHRTMLALMFQNLIGNAIKFVPADRQPRVAVAAAVRDGRLRVTVSDNGIGIAPDDLDKLFRPFSRLHVRRQYDGTGLGLVLCRQVAVLHGGTVEVASQPGVGSRFTVSLPLPRTGRAADAAPPAGQRADAL